MENELENISNSIKYLAQVYFWVSTQHLIISRIGEDFKKILEGKKDEVCQIELDDDMRRKINSVFDTETLSKSMEKLDTSIGVLLKLKKNKQSEEECSDMSDFEKGLKKFGEYLGYLKYNEKSLIDVFYKTENKENYNGSYSTMVLKIVSGDLSRYEELEKGFSDEGEIILE